MITKWTSHLNTEKEKEDFRNEVLGARRVLERLSDILKEDRASLELSEMTLKDFDNPNWAEKQAFKNGYKSCLNAVQKALNLDQRIILIND